MGYIRRHKRGYECIKPLIYIEPTEEEKEIARQRELDRKQRLHSSSIMRLYGAIAATAEILNNGTMKGRY